MRSLRRSRRVLVLAVASLGSLGAPGWGSTALAEAPPRSAAGPSIDSLASELGAPSYSEREAATRALIDIGIGVRPALERLLAASDSEVRDRAEKILRIVMENDFRLRLEAFAADPDGKRRHDLPGWERFSRQMGDQRESRAIFVAMQRAEPTLWEAFATQDPSLNAIFSERCEEACASIPQQEGSGTEAAIGSIATMFFLAGSPEVAVDDSDALMLETLIHYRAFEQGLLNHEGLLDSSLSQSPGFGSGMRTAVARTIYRQLLGMWLARDGAPVVALRKLNLALTFEIKEGGLELSRKLLKGDGGPLEARPNALLTLGRWGSKDDLPLVEHYFADEKVCLLYPPNRREIQVQVREVALAVAAHLTGQDLKSYGFKRVQSNAKFLFLAPSLSLGDEDAKAKAFRKWAEWKAGQSGRETQSNE